MVDLRPPIVLRAFVLTSGTFNLRYDEPIERPYVIGMQGLAAALPHPPRQATVPGGHFIFVDPCPPAVAADAPAACKDAPDVDRAAVHRRIEAEIGDFLRRNL